MAVTGDRLRRFYPRDSTTELTELLDEPQMWPDDDDIDLLIQEEQIFPSSTQDDDVAEVLLSQPPLTTTSSSSKPRLRDILTQEEWNERYPPRTQPHRRVKIASLYECRTIFSEKQQCFYFLPKTSDDGPVYKISTMQLLHTRLKNDLLHDTNAILPAPILNLNNKINVICSLTQSFFDKNVDKQKDKSNMPYYHSKTIQKECLHLFRK